MGVCIKMFLPKNKGRCKESGWCSAYLQGMAKSPGGKNVVTRRRVGPCKGGGGGQLVHATRRRAGPYKTQVINMR